MEVSSVSFIDKTLLKILYCFNERGNVPAICYNLSLFRKNVNNILRNKNYGAFVGATFGRPPCTQNPPPRITRWSTSSVAVRRHLPLIKGEGAGGASPSPTNLGASRAPTSPASPIFSALFCASRRFKSGNVFPLFHIITAIF